MIKVYQTKFGCPGGNCFQASVASLLELELEEVPDFANEDHDNWWKNFSEWIEKRGLSLASSLVNDKLYPVTCIIEGYCLLGVVSKTDKSYRHSVIGHATCSQNRIKFKIVHDPYPGSDLTDPYDIKDVIWVVQNAA